MPRAGYKQSPEHIARRVAAVARAKAQWDDDMRAQESRRVAENNPMTQPEARSKMAASLREHYRNTPVHNKGKRLRTPEERRAMVAAKQRRHRESAPKWRLNDRMSTQIRVALRDAKAGKPWEALVGYSLADLVVHLERQFVPGMTWENMGAWHIDHIVPKVAFHFTSPDDPNFRRCWALKNLRPLWAHENLKKGTRVPTEN